MRHLLDEMHGLPLDLFLTEQLLTCKSPPHHTSGMLGHNMRGL